MERLGWTVSIQFLWHQKVELVIFFFLWTDGNASCSPLFPKDQNRWLVPLRGETKYLGLEVVKKPAIENTPIIIIPSGACVCIVHGDLPSTP